MNVDKVLPKGDGASGDASTHPGPEAPASSSSIDDTPINILIVDDEPKNLVVLETILDDPGYRIVRATSADQALLALVTEEFALLILDIRMPGMTGFELAQTIKARKKTARVPIIFLTAYYNEDQHVLEGYDTGAVDYLLKPVSAPILRSKVAVFAELYRQQRAAVTANRALRELTEALDRRVIERTEALRENERFLQRITEVTPGLIQVFDLETQSCVFVSRAAETLIGYSAEEVQAMGGGVMPTLMHPDDLPRFAEHIQHVGSLRDGEIAMFEHRLRSKSGEHVWLERRDAIFSRDPSGAPRQVIGAAFDVTERKRFEETIRKSEELFRTLAEGMPHCVWLSDATGNYEYQNRAWYEYTGSPAAGDVPTGSGCYHPHDHPRVLEEWNAAVRTDGSHRYDVEVRIRRWDRVYRWFRVTGSPIKDAAGSVLRWVGTCSDIHDQRLALDALNQASLRKDEFLATLAHELRNPLAPVRNAVHLLKIKGPPIPELQWATDVIDRQMHHMSRLLDDLMDVSRISRDRIELRREHVDLAKVVQGAVETSRPLIEECGHELTVTLPSGAVIVHADVTRLAQVFLNLLNNAAKYTARGGQIGLFAEQQGKDVLVSVRDNGVGIAADKLVTIFEMFTQVEGALSGPQGGLGIGLCLVKRLVEMHGGSVDVHSAGRGRGSEFVVRLPIVVDGASARKTGAASHEATPTSHLRILVVDDNQDAAVSLTKLLELMGNSVRTAYDGEEAVRAAEEFRPHVVLCDIGLPKMDGHEACRRIRRASWGKNMILVAVTGWGQEDDKRRSEEAGFRMHMVKPVDPALLMRTLGELDVGNLSSPPDA